MPKKLTTEDFIERAKAIHGDKYDYSKVEYKRVDKKVVIICREHGKFEQNPHEHLKGQGCSKCSGNAKKTTKDFIEKARSIHGDKYDYTKTVYKTSKKDVVIICPIHGEFPQTPNRHLAGNGCPECGNLKIAKKLAMSHREHTETIAKINPHVEALEEITNVRKKVLFRCKVCGHVWPVRPTDLKLGKGCPECAERGFRNSLKSCVYLLVDDVELPTCIKIGVTNDFNRRLDELTHHTPFPIHVLKVFTFEAGCATSQLEQFAHTVFADRNCHFEGFDGCTEWFWYSHEIVDFLEENS